MKRPFSQPHTLFIFFAILFGGIVVFLQPVGAGNDEETHLARIFEFSLNKPIPNSYLGKGGLPESFFLVSYRQKKFLTPVTAEEIRESLQYSVHDPLIIAYRTRATYSPINYFPQAVLMRILGWELDFPLPVLYYVLRFSYVLSYTILVYFAIRLIPVGKWLLFTLALSPITLLQFSSVTSDAITIGVSFLFVSWSLHLIIDHVQMSKKYLIITFGLLFLLASVKVNSIPLLFMLVLLKQDQFSSRKAMVLFWIFLAFLVAVVAGGWNLIAWQSDAVRRGLEDTSPFTVVINSIRNPLAFISGLIEYVAGSLKGILIGWIAAYGYDYWTVPGLVFFLYPVALLFGILHAVGDRQLTSRLRWGLLTLFLISFLGTFALRLILKQNMEAVVSTHGRYFTAIMPLLLIGLTGWGHSHRYSRWFAPLSVSALAISLIIYLGGMGLSFYKLCGENLYTGTECIQPVYKNWNPTEENLILLPQDGLVQQSFVADCDRINQVSLLVFNQKTTLPAGSFSISLIDPSTNAVITKQDILMQSVPANDRVAVDFPVYGGAVNREFFIRIQDVSTLSTLGIAVSERDEYRGSLSVNTQVIDKDALFTYRCAQ